MVCQTLLEEEIQPCTDFILENWRGIAAAMFASDSEIPTDICIGLGFCEPFLDRMVIHLPTYSFSGLRPFIIGKTVEINVPPFSSIIHLHTVY